MAEEQAQGFQATPGRDVFISYASQDKAVAESVCKALESSGQVCWIAPRDVVPGESFAGAIVHAIDATKLIVLVLSEHSATSQHVLREVERASSKRHPVIAFRIDLAPMPADFEYFLNTSQWLDASAAGVKHALPRLVDAAKIALTQPSDGVRASPGVSTTEKVGSHPRRILIALAAVSVVAALGYVVADKFWLSKHVAPVAGAVPSERLPTAAAVAMSDKSIAVLPFVDMSEKHDQEYFSDGLSEELIDHLAHIPDLKVIARTSSFAFKGKNEDMTSIAAKLRVANLLEGSVRKSGETLRITAQLIRASDGVHLWSETYDRKLKDIFQVQDEISTTVAKALNVALNVPSAVDKQPGSRGTESTEVYSLLLQGNYFYVRSGEGDFVRAIGLYQRALTLDPNYAAAWARLALVYGWQGVAGELTSAEAESKGRNAAQRALAINPNWAEAYYARGNIFRLIVGDWAAAKSDYARAVALDPHGEAGEYAQGFIFDLKGAMGGRFDEFIDWARRRLERDPLDTDTMYELAENQQADGHLEDAAATFRRLLELNSAYAFAWGNYGLTLLYMGKNVEALTMAEKETNSAYKLAVLACIYWSMNRRSESDSALGALERGYSDRMQYSIAAVHAYRGEMDAAFTWLNRCVNGSLEYLKVKPILRNLHGDPRFDALLRKAKLSV